MSERKYRQRGYQDEDRPHRPAQKPAERAPGPPRDRIGPRTYNMPGYRQVVRCARCGHIITAEIGPDTRCSKCGTDLRACVQCVHFDTGRRFECAQAIPARVSPKDARNTCELFEPQHRFERETGSTASGPPSARQAFDDLFK
jgi:hypothetical protein